MDPIVTLTDAPSAEARDVIGYALRGYNVEQAGFSDSRPLAVLVSDPETRKVVGGLTGRTSYGLFFLDVLYLPAELRGRGLGERIVREAEEEARRRGCQKVLVYTITFQAPDFYERCGYTRFGEIEIAPPGAGRVFLSKTL